jgi:ABC-type bacteriocin/lantibiotic exporter with double-glycine peptidase domain
MESGNSNHREYGSAGGAADSEPRKPTVDSTTVPPKSWWEYLNDYSLFLPYMWPSKSCHLQIVVIACFALLILQRIANVLVPAQVGTIITALASEQKTKTLSVPWLQVSLFIFYRWLQHSLGSLRSGLWIPMSQYSYLELSTATFEHIHRLSLDFHLSKKTGEVLSAMSKCRNVTAFLEQVVFQLIPTLFDLIIAIGYFLVVFDTYYALVVGISSFLYLFVTIRMAQWRAESSRQMTIRNFWAN